MRHRAAPSDPLAADPHNFSIVLGGPLYQLLRRAHVSGDALELARRRVVVIALIAWLPLLVLAIIAGDAFGGPSAVPFIKDIEVHVRFLVAVPLLVAAEVLVHSRLHPVAQEFVVRGLVPDESLPRFRECVAAAYRWRNSIVAEVAMIVFVYAVGVPFIWRELTIHGVTTWFAVPSANGTKLTLAGVWYAYVSVPLFQFLLLRWYYRMVIWIHFLWQVSRIRLNLSAMHGDQAAGLAFLSVATYAFAPLLMAHGALLSGTIANRIFHMGETLLASRIEIVVMVVYLLVLVLGPLVLFAPQINEAKRAAARLYGRLAQRYVRDFEAKWLPGGMPTSSALGEADIQSLADLANSLEVARQTRVVPVTRDAFVKLALAALVPLAPLLFTMIPAEELARRLLKLIL